MPQSGVQGGACVRVPGDWTCQLVLMLSPDAAALLSNLEAAGEMAFAD